MVSKILLDKGSSFLSCCTVSLLCFTPGTATFYCQRRWFLSPCNAQSEVPSPVSSVVITSHTTVRSYAATAPSKRAIRKKCF